MIFATFSVLAVDVNIIVSFMLSSVLLKPSKVVLPVDRTIIGTGIGSGL